MYYDEGCIVFLFKGVSDFTRGKTRYLDLFNYGESVNTQNEMDTMTKVFHGICIAIVEFEVLFHLGFLGVLLVSAIMARFSIHYPQDLLRRWYFYIINPK